MAQTEKPGVIRDERLLLADVEMSEIVRGKRNGMKLVTGLQ